MSFHRAKENGVQKPLPIFSRVSAPHGTTSDKWLQCVSRPEGSHDRLGRRKAHAQSICFSCAYLEILQGRNADIIAVEADTEGNVLLLSKVKYLPADNQPLARVDKSNGVTRPAARSKSGLNQQG